MAVYSFNEICVDDRRIKLEYSVDETCLKWYRISQPSDYQQLKLLSRKCNGRIFHISLSLKLLKLMFQNREETSLSTVVFVSLNNGNLFLAYLSGEGCFVSCGKLHETVVFADAVIIAGKEVLLVLGCRGTLLLGTPRQNEGKLEFHWLSVCLGTCAISALPLQERLLVSDGMVLTCHHIEFHSKMVLSASHLLPLRGVISLKKSSGEICFKTCLHINSSISDEEILSLCKKAETDEGSAFSQEQKDEAVSIGSAMTGLQKCHKILSIEGKRLQERDEYLNQLTIAQKLLLRSQEDLGVELHTEPLMFYGSDMFITFRIDIPSSLGIAGQWWQLRATLSGRNSVHVLTTHLSCVKSNHHISRIRLPSSEALNFYDEISKVHFTCSLVLTHFHSRKPVCYILLLKEKLCLLQLICFKTNQLMLPEPSVLAAYHSTEIRPSLNNDCPSLNLKVFVNSTAKEHLDKLFNLEQSCSRTLIRNGVAVNLSVAVIDNGYLKLEFDSTDHITVVYVMQALLDYLVKHKSFRENNTNVRISKQLLREIVIKNGLVSIKAHECLHASVIMKLYEMTKNVLGKLPL